MSNSAHRNNKMHGYRMGQTRTHAKKDLRATADPHSIFNSHYHSVEENLKCCTEVQQQSKTQTFK